MKRRMVCMLLVLCMLLTLFPAQVFSAETVEPVDTTNPFRDVAEDSWYYDAVQYVRMNGLFNGTSRTAFTPAGTMTRGMFVTVLGRMAGVDPENYTGASSFTDVAETAYYAPYVAWAAKYGVTVGTGDGKFSPDAFINRQQMATFFVRYFEVFEVDYDTGADNTVMPNDMDSVAPWAQDAVRALWRTGLLVGDGGNFNPAANATRAQAATVCYRMDQAVETWYSEPGVASSRVKIDPATGLPYGSAQPTLYYSVSFYDETRLLTTLYVRKNHALKQLPSVGTSSKAGYILEGYYTDPEFTEPFYAEEPVLGDMVVYAKYVPMDSSETLTVDSFARMDQAKDVSFNIRRVSGNTPASDAAALSVKDGSEPVEISVADNGDGTYRVYAPAGFNEGCSYELNLAEGWAFVDPDTQRNTDTIRTAAFSIAMAEVENLSMNEGIHYIKDTAAIDYTYTDTQSQTHHVEELPSDADITGGGSFQYADTNGWQAGDLLCIYVGGNPDDSSDTEKTEESIYAKVDSVDGASVHFVPLGADDQMQLYDIPDNFPLTVGELPTGAGGTASFAALDEFFYSQMVGEAEGTAANAREKLSVGDFVTLYVSAGLVKTDQDVYFGRITEIDGDTITYVSSSADEIRESSNLYKSVGVENTDLITPEEQQQIERIVQEQVDQSNFAIEAADTLAQMALQTDGFRRSANLLSVSAADADGEALSAQTLRSYADAMTLADDDGDGKPDIGVKVNVVLDPNKLHFGSKGVQLAVEVSAKFEVTAKDDGKIHFDLSATFVQEVAVDPKVKGSLVYKEILGFIPIPTGVQVNSIVDVKSYTAMSLRADIYTEAAEDKPIWEKFKDFANDPSQLADLPGVPQSLTDGLKSVGDAINKIEELESEISKGLDDVKKLQSDLDTLWNVVEASAHSGLTRKSYEDACEALSKTNVAEELMGMMNLSVGDISADYIRGVDDLMDRYAELLEKETGWVQLVDQQMFDAHTPAYFGIMVGVKGSFVVRADINISLGSNLEYEVGKRYNFWFRVGLFKPSSGSSTMDLIDEHFAFQFYVMGKLGIKTGVRLKIYAAIGSVDAISVGLTTELGPYVKLWGFFIYDYSKYRPANTQSWTCKEQMEGAIYLEFGLYLTVGVEAKALFLEYSKDFVDEEFPLLDAGQKHYYYDTAYEPLDDSDAIGIFNDGTAALQPGCAVSMKLPDEAYALRYMDLTTGKQSSEPLDYKNYIFKLSNPNFRIDNVNGTPVISVVSIPDNVRLMECDLTVTYRNGKKPFSSFDMTVTVPLVWTNMTKEEYQQVFTASVTIPDGKGGQETIWSKRVRKGQPFDLPADEEIRKLLNWSDTKYAAAGGYGSQQTTGLTIVEDWAYTYDLAYQTYSLTVTGIQGESDTQTFTANYGAPFDFSSLKKTGASGPDEYTRFAGLRINDNPFDLNQTVSGDLAYLLLNGLTAEAQYVEDSITATFRFSGISPAPADMTVKLRKGDTPDTQGVLAAVPEGMAITAFYPAVGAMEGDTVYEVVCETPRGEPTSVVFHPNNGDDDWSITQLEGSLLGYLPKVTRTGYLFEGWFADPDFQTSVSPNTAVSVGGMNLYAKWSPIDVTVTFNPDGGLSLGEAGSKTVTFDASYGTLPKPTRSGYSFRGWFTGKNATGTRVTDATVVKTAEDHTIYAYWVELKTIPRSVFAFTNQTPTYDEAAHYASYTFNPQAGETYQQGEFTIRYIRQADQFITDNVYVDQPTNAGYYNVQITRDADEDYNKFDENYTNVLIINKADWVEAVYNKGLFPLKIEGKDGTLTNWITVRTPEYEGYLPASIRSGMQFRVYRPKVSIAFPKKDETHNFNSHFEDNGSGATIDVYLKFPANAVTMNYSLPAEVKIYHGGIRDLYEKTTWCPWKP